MLRDIGEFCPPGTQLKSPPGFSLDPKRVIALETSAGYLRVVFRGYAAHLEFYRGPEDAPPRIAEIAQNIRNAANARETGS